MAMKLKTGKVEFPIEFDNGDRESIYFNPNDPDLFTRFVDFEKKMNKKMEELDDFDLKNNGEPNDIRFVDRFRKINEILCEELDIAFGGNISEIVFKHCSPFAIVGGEYFLIQFVNAIKPEIEKSNKKAQEELNKKMQKHTAKYQKK